MKNYDLIWEGVKLTVHFRGTLTLEDVFQLCNERIGNELFCSVKYVLNDMSEVDSITLKEEEMNYANIYSSVSRLFGDRRDLLSAFVVPNDEIEKKVQRYIDASQKKPNDWQRKIFRSIEQADAWAMEKLKK
ncbi:hypothetical protein [Pelagicoccus sp. SDUM812003]|uniref:hypothetical protein n=1 Tax=Pelagicoccus sp. SDUM812003 TaxID=3041267 RepID=UPI00280D4058|nr:hypothetical protein [Pelagicoccus sp. SDUM812003]MDQ8205783.1 hypothetical protein [Pelagicoccus sp. SDUM812003]